jgi:hypothetical protein
MPSIGQIRERLRYGCFFQFEYQKISDKVWEKRPKARPMPWTEKNPPTENLLFHSSGTSAFVEAFERWPIRGDGPYTWNDFDAAEKADNEMRKQLGQIDIIDRAEHKG